jgi:hypothetical protein
MNFSFFMKYNTDTNSHSVYMRTHTDPSHYYKHLAVERHTICERHTLKRITLLISKIHLEKYENPHGARNLISITI